MTIPKGIRHEIRDLTDTEYAPTESAIGCRADMSLNVNPLGPAPQVVKRLHELEPGRVSQYHPESRALKHAIASYVHAAPESVLLGDGCDGCLELIAKAFISPGDKVLIPTPTFHRYEFHTKVMGGVPEFVEMPQSSFEADRIVERLREGGFKMLFLCNPNNPTGTEIPREAKLKILAAFDGLIVIDEALADAAGVNGTDLVGKYPNLIITRSFSKSFGLAALRIGYIVADPATVTYLRKASSPFKVNGVAQELARVALESVDHLSRSREFIARERGLLVQGLEALGLPCTASTTTNFIVDVGTLRLKAAEIAQALHGSQVLVTETSAFRMPAGEYLRLAVSTERENRVFLEEMRRLCAALRDGESADAQHR